MDIYTYFHICSVFDWYYDMSDAFSVYLFGKKQEYSLWAVAQTNDSYMRIYTDWHDYFFSGANFCTEKKKLPELSDYI